MAIDIKTRRLQVTLSDSTVDLIDKLLQEGYSTSRSAFLNEAALHYATRLKRAQLKRQLRAGYLAREQRDRELVQEWENVNLDVLWD